MQKKERERERERGRGGGGGRERERERETVNGIESESERLIDGEAKVSGGNKYKKRGAGSVVERVTPSKKIRA